MNTVSVELEKRSYDIVIGKNIFSEISKKISKKYKKILIVTNDKVGPIYLEKLKEGVKNISNEIYSYEISDGEDYKKIESILPIYDFMVENNFDRSSLVISLGGGVICDMTGYIAATFMRGIDFIQVPTTLLAQVDASVGGKVAVNHKNAKNLIGAFYQPKLVLIDIATLSTLDIRELKTGLAEAIKHGIILDKNYFDFIKNNSKEILELREDIIMHLVTRSCELKASVVSQDEEEKGLRAILNYGHTFGHVVESLTQYSIYRHGEAVVLGMSFAGLLAKELGLVNQEFIEAQNEIFEKFEMDYIVPKYDFKKMLEILKHDKKVKEGKFIFILPEAIGKVRIEKVEEDIVENCYKKLIGKKVQGVIDIGTNTVRLFIAEVLENRILKKYAKFSEITRLGEDVDKNRLLKEEAIERNIKCLKKYAEIAKEYGVSSLRAAATSASRDAGNGNVFLTRAKNEAGLDINIISGNEEGTFAFNGVISDIDENDENDILVIDIGGGSTEFILGNKKEIKFIKSLDIGSVRVKEKFFSDEEYDKNLVEAKKWIKEILIEVEEVKKSKYVFMGVAGTITTQVSVAEKMEVYNSKKVHGFILKENQITENLELFKSMNVKERENIVGLNPKRADVIVAGTILLQTILEFLENKSIIVSECDILEGLMLSK